MEQVEGFFFLSTELLKKLIIKPIIILPNKLYLLHLEHATEKEHDNM